jgi:hypothetical protein
MIGKTRVFSKGRWLILLFVLHFSLESIAQKFEETSISGSFNHIPVQEFLNTIEKKFPVKFYFQPEWFNHLYVDLSVDKIPIRTALDKIFNNTSYQYEMIDNNIVFLPKLDAAIIESNFDAKNGYSAEENTTIVGISNSKNKDKVVLKGQIKDEKTDKPVAGAKISIRNTTIETVSDDKGYYSFMLPTGSYNIELHSKGFDEISFGIKLVGSGNFDMHLFDQSEKLKEVTISVQKADKNVNRNQMSIVELDSKTIKQLPMSFGEKDIIRSLTMHPGIKTLGEFGSGINVRGGSNDQNLFLLEGAPIFNTSHVFGLLSVINSDAVSNLVLYKGDIPASYGERIASVINLQLKDGMNNAFKVNGGIGLLDSRLMIESPIVKDKLSFAFGGRTSYSDWLLKNIPDPDLRNSSAKFYDLNGSLTWKLNNNNKFEASFYKSYDYFHYSTTLNYNYDNLLGSVRWNHFFNGNFFLSTLLSASNYNVSKDEIDNTFDKSRTISNINYKSARVSAHYTPGKVHSLEFGVQTIYYSINPGQIKPLDTLSLVPPSLLQHEQALESAIYLLDKVNFSENFSLTAGLRYTAFNDLGPKTIYEYQNNQPRLPQYIIDSVTYEKNSIIHTFNSLEPRLSLKYQFKKSSSIKLSYNKSRQYLSLVSYTSVPTPDDIWKLSDPNLKPLVCDQYAIGFFRNFHQNMIETSIELYYKELNNLIDYKNNAQLSMNPYIETALINTKGKNYGVELMVKKNSGRVEGWISYTYSRTLKKSEGHFTDEIINNNAYYPSSYDKPHDLTLTATYHYNRRLRFSCNFNLSSGRPITLPEKKYILDNQWVSYYSDRNAYRLPLYHRLDLAITRDENLKLKRNWKGSWTFSIINVYARKNAYSVFYKKAEPDMSNNYSAFSLFKLYIIGQPLPTLTYNFTF